MHTEGWRGGRRLQRPARARGPTPGRGGDVGHRALGAVSRTPRRGREVGAQRAVHALGRTPGGGGQVDDHRAVARGRTPEWGGEVGHRRDTREGVAGVERRGARGRRVACKRRGDQEENKKHHLVQFNERVSVFG